MSKFKRFIGLVLVMASLFGSLGAMFVEPFDFEAETDEMIGSEIISDEMTDDTEATQDAETEEPIPGVRVKFCSDSMCMMGKTDEKGCALFNQDPGEYTAHILKAPEGYEKNEEEIVLTADEHIATFKLNKIK